MKAALHKSRTSPDSSLIVAPIVTPTKIYYFFFIFILLVFEGFLVTFVFGRVFFCLLFLKQKETLCYEQKVKYKMESISAVFFPTGHGEFCNRLDIGYVLVHTRPDNSKGFRVML